MVSQDAPFVPRCPGCEYDLSGTPGERCPECGQLFNRAQVWNPPPLVDDWPENVVLVVAVVAAAMELGSRISPARWAQFALCWGLTFLWLYLRRRSLLGSKPWLALWLVAIAMGTSDTLDDATGLDVTPYYVMGVAVVALGFGLARAPSAFGSTVLFIVAAPMVFCGGGFVIMAVAGQCGLVPGGEWNLLGYRATTGGTGDFVGGGVGLAMAVAGFSLWRLAERPRAGSSPTRS